MKPTSFQNYLQGIKDFSHTISNAVNVLLLALYGCILFVFKEITPQDLALFKDMLQPNKATLQQNL